MVYSKNPQSPKLKYPFQSLEARDFEAAHLIFCCLKHIRLPLIEAFFNYGVVIDSPKKPSGVFSLTKQHCETCSFSCTWPWVGSRSSVVGYGKCIRMQVLTFEGP